MSAFARFDPAAYLREAQKAGANARTCDSAEPAAKAAKVAKVSGSEEQTLAGLATLAGAATDGAVAVRDWIDERAAILEYDAGKPRAEAERLAYEAALARWQHEHPPAYADQDRCAACGEWLIDDLLPLAERDARGSPVWVHLTGGCWRDYVQKRRAEAEAAVHH